MELELKSSKMATNIRATTSTANSMDKASSPVELARSTLANSRTGLNMGSETGKTNKVTLSMVNMPTTRRVDRANSSGPVTTTTKESISMI